VTIRTDGWIKLDTKQLDKIAKFDSSARNFHSTRVVHLVTLHMLAAQHHFHFRQVKKQFVLQEPPIDIVTTLRDRTQYVKCVLCVCCQNSMQLYNSLSVMSHTDCFVTAIMLVWLSNSCLFNYICNVWLVELPQSYNSPRHSPSAKATKMLSDYVRVYLMISC